MKTPKPTFWIAAVALIGVAACSRGGQSDQAMDDQLKRDLAAARSAPTAQFAISPLEAGLSPAPKAPERSAQPTRRPAKQVATIRPVAPSRAPAPAPAPATREVAVTPTPSQPVEPAPLPPAPRPAPAAARGEDTHRGPYKTEAEIFRQMPWIRP